MNERTKWTAAEANPARSRPSLRRIDVDPDTYPGLFCSQRTSCYHYQGQAES